MMYNLFLTDVLEPDRLAATLAQYFDVPSAEVEVSDANADEDRNWDAVLSCTYEQVHGDLTWALEVTGADRESGRVSEIDLAAVLAAGLGQSVLCPAQPFPPSAYWIASPDGVRARARVYESDEEDLVYTIDAVSREVSGLPQLRVASQPEVIREHRMPTPVAAELAVRLSARRESVPADGRESVPEIERYVRTRLGAWEALAARMKSNWPPDGWYPVDYYREDLETRDELESAISGLDDGAAEMLREALGKVDGVFRDSTLEDGGATLGEALSLTRLDLALRGWWWRCIPDPLPWEQAEL
ncbi:hypothetical protein ABIA33_005690 [Streptacidiphilus sp. MAP12-16]|uniref:hypothetical protein n=1 Tax=Streptacidiphilus sp. MAP12-16 TaxID=3156300 RepID=UPI003516B44C